MLSEKSKIDAIEIKSDSEIHVKEVCTIFRDGVEVSQTCSRRTYGPSNGIDDKGARVQDFIADRETDPRIKTIADVLWTPEVVRAHQKERAKVSVDRES